MASTFAVLRARRLAGAGLLATIVVLTAPAIAEQAPAGDEVKIEPVGSLLGSYLAGRIAHDERDPEAATAYYRDALKKQPDDPLLLRQAFLAEAELGAWEQAGELADRVVKVETGDRWARIFLGVRSFKQGNFNESDKHFELASAGSIAELTGALARAWVKAAEGNLAGARSQLDTLKSADWARYYRVYHEALIADLLGDDKVARATYQELFQTEPKIVSVALAYARFESSRGDNARAQQILKDHLAGDDQPHAMVQELLASIRRGEKQTPAIGSAEEGLAEVFYGIGEQLASENAHDTGVIFLQLALYLRPDSPLTLIALSGVQEQIGRSDMAIKTLDRIPTDTALGFSSAIRKAFNLNQLDRVDEARSALKELLEPKRLAVVADTEVEDPLPNPAIAETFANIGPGSRNAQVTELQQLLGQLGFDPGPIDGIFGKASVEALKAFQGSAGLEATGRIGPQTRTALAQRVTTLAAERAKVPARIWQIRIHTALGSILSNRKFYADAAENYSAAIALVPNPDKDQWNQYFQRAICYERLKQWDKAEPDFLKAMELDPEQPSLLNYLGYSWVDQGKNLSQAMDLIRKAVKLKPDDGFYVDSLGWAHYRLGEFDEATRQLERAVELEPNDPIINDHLGDAYWQVGRRNEARFQWSQSLTLKPEPEDKERIAKKLEKGLDTIQGTTAEGATSTQPVQ
ncbi:MAG: tetratricopeptide repeat protein [Hyphomicrobiaceae bacterium]